jgi:hypothetical protein
MFNINKEFNPGSVGRLGADLIHASLLQFNNCELNGAKVSTIKKSKLLFE